MINPSKTARMNVASRVIARASALTGMPVRILLERTRRVPIPHARFGIAWALRQRGWGLQRIADELGFKDHTSIIHAEKMATKLRETDPGFRYYTDDLLTEAGGPISKAV